MQRPDYVLSLVDDCAVPIVGQLASSSVFSWNSAAERLFGYAARDIVGRSGRVLVPDSHVAEEDTLLATACSGEAVADVDTVRCRADGTQIRVTLTMSPVRDRSSRIVGASTIFRARRETTDFVRSLERAAYHDALTGVLNRAGLQRELDKAARAMNSVESRAALFFDLDHFKEVNDTSGHVIGDAVLRHCGRRLRAGVRSGDVVCRWGGDEFVIVLRNLPSRLGRARSVVRRAASALLTALREPYCIDGATYTCPPSVGTYLYTTGDVDDLTAIEAADRSMYDVKRRGRNGLEMAECPRASTTPLRKAVGR